MSVTAGTGLTGGTITTSGTIAVDANMQIIGIPFVIDGGGAAITTGIKGYLQVPFAATITEVTMLADQSGSIVVDIWKTTYASFNPPTTPTATQSITASDKPTISSALKYDDTALTSWTKSISAGDILAFNVNSATTVQRVTIELFLTRN